MNDTAKGIIKPVAAVGLTCLTVTALLAVTNYFTAPVIALAGNEKAAAALSLVLPDGKDFKPVLLEHENIISTFKAENGAGYAITAAVAGYHGDISVMFGIDENGKIIGVEVLEQSETKGLGDKITTPEYRNQYLGKGSGLYTVKGTAANEKEISAISGATTSSTAMTTAANTALAAYNTLS